MIAKFLLRKEKPSVEKAKMAGALFSINLQFSIKNELFQIIKNISINFNKIQAISKEKSQQFLLNSHNKNPLWPTQKTTLFHITDFFPLNNEFKQASFHRSLHYSFKFGKSTWKDVSKLKILKKINLIFNLLNLFVKKEKKIHQNGKRNFPIKFIVCEIRWKLWLKSDGISNFFHETWHFLTVFFLCRLHFAASRKFNFL